MTTDRRQFARAVAGAFVATSVLHGSSPGAAETLGSLPFPLSVMLWTVFRDLPFEQRLEKVSEAGYQAVELVSEFKNWTDADYHSANRRKRQLGITFDATAGIHRSLCDPSERDAFLAEVRGMVPVMEQLECTKLIVLSGNKVQGLSLADHRASCIEGLKQAAEVMVPKKFDLLLENIDPEENPQCFLTSVAEGFEIVREVNTPNVMFLYDFFHEQIAEGNLIEKLEKNIARVGLVHVADVPGRHEPGTGEINYPNIFRKLTQLKYNRYAAMEFLPTGEPVESLRAARELVRKSVA